MAKKVLVQMKCSAKLADLMTKIARQAALSRAQMVKMIVIKHLRAIEMLSQDENPDSDE